MYVFFAKIFGPILLLVTFERTKPRPDNDFQKGCVKMGLTTLAMNIRNETSLCTENISSARLVKRSKSLGPALP